MDTGKSRLGHFFDRAGARRVSRSLIGAGMACLVGFLPLWSQACTLNDWSRIQDGSGNLTVGTPLHFEADCGLEVALSGQPAYVEDQSPGLLSDPVTRYVARFYLLPDRIAIANGDTLTLFAGYTNSRSTPLFELLLVRLSGEHRLRLVAYADNGAKYTTLGHEMKLIDGWRALELEWLAAVSASLSDGGLKLRVDGVAGQGGQLLSGLDNDAYPLDYVQLGMVAGSAGASGGELALDAFVSQRGGSPGVINKPCSGDAVVVDHHTFLPGSTSCEANLALSTNGYVTVDSGADVVFSGTSISLKPGFSAARGSQFRAMPNP